MSTQQPYKGPISGPCSACGDGDTTMKYHDHEPCTNLREFPRRVGIVINYDQWRPLMREFIDEVAGADDDLKVQMEWTLEIFLQWLRRKRQETINGADSSK